VTVEILYMGEERNETGPGLSCALAALQCEELVQLCPTL